MHLKLFCLRSESAQYIEDAKTANPLNEFLKLINSRKHHSPGGLHYQEECTHDSMFCYKLITLQSQSKFYQSRCYDRFYKEGFKQCHATIYRYQLAIYADL